MIQEGQWEIDGYCIHCGAPRYTNYDLGRTQWKDGGFDCHHELERPEPEMDADTMRREDR